MGAHDQAITAAQRALALATAGGDAVPQVLANDLVADLEHPLAGHLRMVGPPLKLSDTPARAQSASPPLGHDTDAILGSLGYTPEQIEGLRATGVTR
jgi:crotonobetainyl-CoA:carnitine CoA-transferase CaiB-like acyl-CoA transferase